MAEPVMQEVEKSRAGGKVETENEDAGREREKKEKKR